MKYLISQLEALGFNPRALLGTIGIVSAIVIMSIISGGCQNQVRIIPAEGIDISDIPDTLNGKFIVDLTIWTADNIAKEVKATLTPMQYATIMNASNDVFTVFVKNGSIIKIIINDQTIKNSNTGKTRQIRGFTIWSE